MLAGRLSIGRAASSDLHLESSNVSRQHAQVIEDPQGGHVLVDLASSNGTFMGGKSVERHVLRPNAFFTIGGIDLVYEEARGPEGHPSTAPATGIRTLRSTETMPHCDATGQESSRQSVAGPDAAGPDVAGPGPTTRDYPSVEELRRFEAPTRDYPTAEELEAQREASLATARPGGATDTGGHPVVFQTPDGTDYAGALIDDIVEYRSLRSRHLRGGLVDPDMRQRFDDLRARLRQPPSTDPRLSQRIFCRFGCRLEVRLRLADGAEYLGQMQDLGVDGARVDIEGHRIEPDAIVWLTIERHAPERSSSVVLAGRVAWTHRERLGIAFAGAPSRAQGRYAEQPGPEGRDQVASRVEARVARLRLAPGADQS